MKIEFSTTQTVSSDTVIANLVSFALIVSAVVFLGAVCRYLKECCARLSKKKNKGNDVIAFAEVRRISQMRKSYSAPKINTQDYSIVHQEELPIDTEKIPVQPEICALKKEIFSRPRAPTDPGSSPKVLYTLSSMYEWLLCWIAFFYWTSRFRTDKAIQYTSKVSLVPIFLL